MTLHISFQILTIFFWDFEVEEESYCLFDELLIFDGRYKVLASETPHHNILNCSYGYATLLTVNVLSLCWHSYSSLVKERLLLPFYLQWVICIRQHYSLFRWKETLKIRVEL